MYAGGRPHPLRVPCVRILFLAAVQPQAFLTDAEVLQEVLQELLHRYLAIREWRPRGREIFTEFSQLMRGRVETVRAADVERAAMLADSYPELAARDLLHGAVMQRLGVRQIISADAGFDRIAEVERLDPAALPSWEASLLA